MSRTRDGASSASCDGEGVSARRRGRVAYEPLHSASTPSPFAARPGATAPVSGRTRLTVRRMIPLSVGIRRALQLRSPRRFTPASARDQRQRDNASDRLAILADGALLQVSMAVTRADEGPDHMREAAEPGPSERAGLSACLANGIYAYVMLRPIRRGVCIDLGSRRTAIGCGLPKQR
jgi:hypothetical protein